MFFKYFVITQVLSMTFKKTQNPPNLMVIVLLVLKIKLFSYTSDQMIDDSRDSVGGIFSP